MQKHICIYQIRSLRDGKIYIGSSKCSGKRKNEHFARLRVSKHGNSKLQRAYNKYGESNFVFEVLEIVYSVSSLEIREQFYLDTLKPFYNICLIANSIQGIPRTKEWAEKISKSNIGRIPSVETRLKMRLAKLGKSPVNKGVQMSLETKRKVSESKKGTPAWNKGKKLSESHKANVKAGQIKAGYQHSFEMRKHIGEMNLGKKSMPVIQMDINKNIIKEFPSVTDALKICTGAANVLTGRTKTANGFLWIYKKDI